MQKNPAPKEWSPCSSQEFRPELLQPLLKSFKLQQQESSCCCWLLWHYFMSGLFICPPGKENIFQDVKIFCLPSFNCKRSLRWGGKSVCLSNFGVAYAYIFHTPKLKECWGCKKISTGKLGKVRNKIDTSRIGTPLAAGVSCSIGVTSPWCHRTTAFCLRWWAI